MTAEILRLESEGWKPEAIAAYLGMARADVLDRLSQQPEPACGSGATHVNPEDIRRLRAAPYRMTIKAIAQRLGCGTGAVRYHLAVRPPAVRRTSDRVAPEIRSEAVRRYVEEELSVQAVANEFNVNHSTVNYWVTKAGVKRPPVPVEKPVLHYKRPKHLVDAKAEALMFELRAEGLSLATISHRVGFSIMTVSRRLSGLFGKARVRAESETPEVPRLVTRPLEDLQPPAPVLSDVRARLARVMRAAGDHKRLPIASERAYCTLRELAIDANEVAPWLTTEEVRFAERLMEACEHFQAIHGLQKLRDAA